jgi:chemotaxis protein CheX
MTGLEQGQILEAIRGATLEVFATMLGADATPQAHYCEQCAPAPGDGVVSLVGLAGPWGGTGGVYCSAEFACKMCSHMLMMEATSVNDEVLDAVGELTNMIIGNFKTQIESHVGPLGLSIPTVIYGRNFTTRSPNSDKWLVVPFECWDDTFEVKICVAPNPAAASHPRGMANAAALMA